MKIAVNCKKCGHENTVGLRNFNKTDLLSIEGKAFAFKCKSCSEVLKFKIQDNGQNKG